MAALRLTGPWRDTEDPDVEAAFADAQRVRAEAREGELAAAVRRIPASDLEANQAAYAELVGLDPENERYEERLAHYEGLLREREQARLARIERFGPVPQRTGFSGIYYGAVRNYLREVANDPSSIDIRSCTNVYQIDSGWLVGCDYRGANAFGGIVLQSNWFTIVHGRVIAMEAASRYSR